MQKTNCKTAKQIDMVSYLSFLGYLPQQIKNDNHWYLSPLRDEATASFKVDKKRNLWFDFGDGKGGDLIDFGTLYFKCSVLEFLSKLDDAKFDFSFHQPVSLNPSAGEKKDNSESKIVIIEAQPLKEKSLLEYLNQRNISIAIAQQHCSEVNFLLYSRRQTVIGFQNNAGGYELRSADFKGSSSPKAITFISHNTSEVNVFEGFFNYLSFLSASEKQEWSLTNRQTNFLILNSLSFFEQSRPLMEKHKQVTLYLDRDKAGMRCTQQALQWDNNKYNDRSHLYQKYKDLNEWLINSEHETKHKLRILKGFRL